MSSIARDVFAKYTASSIDVVRMTHAQFLNFVEFIIQQPNVDDGQNIRDTMGAYNKLKNKKYKNTREMINLIISLLVYILFVYFVVGYLIVTIVYFIMYYNKDVVKQWIGVTLMGIILSALALFFIFFWLLMQIIAQFKNIIFLM